MYNFCLKSVPQFGTSCIHKPHKDIFLFCMFTVSVLFGIWKCMSCCCVKQRLKIYILCSDLCQVEVCAKLQWEAVH